MLAYDLAHWSSFLAAALLLNIAPGPDMAFIISHTVKGGRKAGMSAMFGIWTGAFGHVLLAALGLSAIIAASATAFTLIKWVGAAYLIWLGVNALRSQGEVLSACSQAPSDGVRADFWNVYRQGVLIDLFNPKVATFFLAFLPQFVVEGAGPVWIQLLVHGVLIIVVAVLIEPPLIFLGDSLTARLRSSPRFSKWLDRTLGTVLVALGIRLAMLER